VHGTTFQQVSAHWRQPRAACVRGKTTYSAMWVGLGGFSTTSNALEQIGTELDCTLGGRVASSAWYELVPSPSHTLGLRIRPGDEVSASVAFGASGVTMAISDLTSGRSFQRTFHPTTVDVTAAEWILEAPSACIQGTSFCRTLPLTDFGHATFTTARALGGAATLGTISSGAWSHTRINLVPNGQQFATNRSGAVPFGTARASSLSPNGGTFNVTFRRVYVKPGTGFGHRLPRGPSYLRH
jgi:hypothetical protein